MKLELRPYQQEAIDRAKLFFEKGGTAGIIHLFTSAGKTFLSQQMILQSAPPKDKRTVFISPAHLVNQTYDAFKGGFDEVYYTKHKGNVEISAGLGVVKAHISHPDSRVIVASASTLVDRTLKEELINKTFRPLEPSDVKVLPNGSILQSEESDSTCLVSARFDQVLANGGLPYLVIHDEAHHSVADGTLAFMWRLWELCDLVGVPRTKLIGLTATPFREDERSLASLYETIIISRSLMWAIQHGYVAPLKQPIRVMVNSDGGTVRVMDTVNWKERILEAYKEHGENRPFMATMASVDDSREFALYMSSQGIPTAHIDGTRTTLPNGEDAPLNARYDVYQKAAEGEIVGLSNYGVLNEGFNLPHISLLLWARPTENLVLFTQTVGRIVRKFSGNEYWKTKDDALILDFTGNALTVLPSGTLAGKEVDPYHIREVDEEVELELLEGIDLRDVDLANGRVHGKENVYTITQLLSKQRTDFFFEEYTSSFSLSVNETDVLLITNPNWTISKQLPESVPEEVKQQFTEFALWHFQKPKHSKQYVLVGGAPVMYSNSLDYLLTDSVLYAYERIGIVVKGFVNKSANWKRQPATSQQITLLKQVAPRNFTIDPALNRGEVSKLISHFLVYPLALRWQVQKVKEIL